jgi:hypothetical protein
MMNIYFGKSLHEFEKVSELFEMSFGLDFVYFRREGFGLIFGLFLWKIKNTEEILHSVRHTQ